MPKIAVLGPVRTFSDLAANKYCKSLGSSMTPVYYSSITKAFNAIGSECEFGIIPIENTLDGYVQIALDLLANSDLKIIQEIVLPIRFSFVGNCKEIEDVKKIYVQFKTHNQCINFIEGLGAVDIITTQSNGVSHEAFLKGKIGEAAIIPSHLLSDQTLVQCMKEDVADSVNNETRFVILSSKASTDQNPNVSWRTSFVVSSDSDRPGLLCDILSEFSKRNINLLSIISRPTKSGVGNYNFLLTSMDVTKWMRLLDRLYG